MKLPKWTEPYVFAVMLSGMMSAVVSAVATFNAIGLDDAFAAKWVGSWLSAWLIATPTVMVVGPFVRRLIPKVVQQN